MLGASYTRNGPAREIFEVGELPTPEPGPGEVRVRLYTSGVNRSDVRSRVGRPLGGPLIVPHSDGAGVIDKVGANVQAERIGERVWIWNGQWQRPMGTAAQFIALPSRQAVALPDNTDFIAGACLGIPACTAFQAVRLLGEIGGKTILVTGAASSVGSYVTQIASRFAHATVIGTVGTTENGGRARANGASSIVNYKSAPLAQQISGFTGGEGVDAVIDMDFSSTAKLLPDNILKPRGTIVAYGSNVGGLVPIPFDKMVTSSYALKFFHVYQLEDEDRRAGVEGIGRMLASSQLAHRTEVFPLTAIADAHEAVERGSARGHVVLTMS